MTAVSLHVDRAEAVPFRIPMLGGVYEGVLVLLHGEGLTGVGEAPTSIARGEAVKEVAGQLQSWCDSGGHGPLGPAAACGVGIAELDLRARVAGIPLCELLGGARRSVIDCNLLVSGRTPRAVAAEVEESSALGFRAFKLKALNGGGPLDLERLGAARWAAGPAAELRLDFNGRLSMPEAELAAASLHPSGVNLLEQPLPTSAPLEQWIKLADRSGIPIAADESLANLSLGRRLAAEGVTLAIKLGTVGGARAALDLARLATGPVLVASSYETSIGLAAALHVACALEVAPAACGLATRGLLEADLATGLPAPGPRLQLPDGVGLGVELDPDAIARYRVDR